MIYARRHAAQLAANGDCPTCCMEPRCWPDGTPARCALSTERLPPLSKGMVLWRPGDEYAGSYLVRSGALKIVAMDAAGDEQVLHFALPGDLIGLESMASGKHDSMAVALEESVLCRVRWPQPGTTSDPPMQLMLRASRNLHQRLGGGRHAEPLPTIRAFVHAIARQVGREERHGTARVTRVQLPMSRLEIGQYLGYSEETVCRALRRLHRLGELDVKGRVVRMAAAG